jgi:hypothetical protein
VNEFQDFVLEQHLVVWQQGVGGFVFPSFRLAKRRNKPGKQGPASVFVRSVIGSVAQRNDTNPVDFGFVNKRVAYRKGSF